MKAPGSYSMDTEKLILKFMWRGKRPRIANTILKKGRQENRCVLTSKFTLKHNYRSKWQPTPVFLPGEFHGQRSLKEYSPWGSKEPDMPEQLSTAEHMVEVINSGTKLLVALILGSNTYK